MKKLISRSMLTLMLFGAGNAYAIDEVFDIVAEVQAGLTATYTAATDVTTKAMEALEKAAWVQQAKDMMASLNGMKSTYDSMSNAVMDPMGFLTGELKDRGWGLTSGITLAQRKYLPDTYQKILDEGNNPTRPLGAAAKIYKDQVTKGSVLGDMLAFAGMGSGFDDDLKKIKKENLAQAAINRALGDEIYQQAAKRTDNIQKLLVKIKDAKEPKDIMDLQAAIQAEGVQQQNEQIKLGAITLLQQAQRDLDEERKKYLLEKKLKMSLI